MDDGEIDFSNHEMFSSPNIPSCFFKDSDLDEFLKETCTHTHTCNPPGPDSSHTHTCHHVHTKIVPAAKTQDKVVSTTDIAECSKKKSKRCPAGNREAVRKYREKKKARTASLEDEVVRLKAVNQQLMKRLQGQAALEAEVSRLKCLLGDIRGRIDGEIGSFPYQRPFKNGDMCQNLANPINPCNGQGFGGCEFENLQCLGNQNAGPNEFPGAN